jgi:hypothetical protein
MRRVAALGSGFVSDAARVNGTTLHYVRGGAGPAITFCYTVFRRLVRISPHHAAVGEAITVVAVDLRGIGGPAATARWLRCWDDPRQTK